VSSDNTFTSYSPNLFLVPQLPGTYVDAVHEGLLERLSSDNGESDMGNNIESMICSPGTRAHCLERVDNWVKMSTKRIFWVNGFAGSGKSTIAFTVAHHMHKYIGATFYFTRHNQPRNKRAICVLARKLAHWRNDSLKPAIIGAIKSHPDITNLLPSSQFLHLIAEPLHGLVGDLPPILLVVDGLDEMEDDDFAVQFILLIKSAHLPSSVKFLITSRDVPHLRKALRPDDIRSPVEHQSLNDEPRDTVDSDIEAYFQQTLPPLVEDEVDWPGPQYRMALVHRAEGLFQWASAAVAFLADGDAESRLPTLLTISSSRLDDLYSRILTHIFRAGVRWYDTSLIHDVLGVIVVASTPMTLPAIAYLLVGGGKRQEQRIQKEVLDLLRPMLVVSSTDTTSHTIKFMHSSIGDYFTDNTRCTDPRFFIDKEQQHQKLAQLCLRSMDHDLKRDICAIADHTKLNSEIPNLKDLLEASIPMGLRYSCLSWALHVAQSGDNSSLLYEHVDTFIKHQILYWLEVLSLLDTLDKAISILVDAQNWLAVRARLLCLWPPPLLIL
jgi:hypothetical protein